jgi:hypothetical protein
VAHAWLVEYEYEIVNSQIMNWSLSLTKIGIIPTSVTSVPAGIIVSVERIVCHSYQCIRKFCESEPTVYYIIINY